MAVGIMTGGTPEAPEITKSYEGAVLATRERNGYDDSDFYAFVWTGEKIESVEYATTRGWTYRNFATVDATPEVVEAATAYLAGLIFSRMREAALAAAKKPEKGRTVKIVRGRKIPLGTVGTVVWEGPAREFGPRYRWERQRPAPRRIGFKPEGGGEVVFTAAENAETVDPEEYLEAESELRRKAAYAAENAARSGTWTNALLGFVPGWVFM